MRLRTPTDIGLFPLRDHREKEALAPHRLDMRYVLGGYRIAERRSDVPEMEAVEPGDLQGALFWAPGPASGPADSKAGKRPVGSWWLGSPPAVIEASDIPAPTTSEGPGRGKQSFVVPIKDRALRVDSRYEALEVLRTGGGLPSRLHRQTETDTRIRVVMPSGPKGSLGAELPGGWPGLVTTGSEEHSGELLFMPAGGMLVSHWRNKPNRFSTFVHDIGKDQGLALFHAAQLDTVWRVTALPEEEGSIPAIPPPRAVAWVGTHSPEDDLAGKGMMVHREVTFKPPAARPPPITAPPGAEGSVDPLAGTGLYDPSSRPGSLWVYGERKPAPGSKAPPPAILLVGKLVNAYASLEGGGPFTAGGPKCQHRFGPNRDGEHFAPVHLQAGALWWAGDVMDGPLGFELRGWPGAGEYPENALVHLVHDKALSHPWAKGSLSKLREGKGGWRWYAEVPWQPCKPPTGVPTMVTVGGASGSGSPGGAAGGVGGSGGGGNPGGPVVPVMAARPTEAVNEVGVPALAFRPEKPWVPGGDLRYARRVSAAQRAKREKAPMVGRFEAFGESLAGCRWQRTRNPRSRYEYGEGPGGVAFLPPNKGVEDVRGATTLGSQRAAVVTWLACIGTRFAIAGGLDTEEGLPVSGWGWRLSGANLLFSELDAVGAEDGRLLMRSGDGAEFQTGTLHPIRSVAVNTTLTLADHTLLVDADGGDRTANLPTAVGNAGLVFEIKKVSGIPANVVTIQPTGGQQIDGAANKNLVMAMSSVQLKSDGANWWIF